MLLKNLLAALMCGVLFLSGVAVRADKYDDAVAASDAAYSANYADNLNNDYLNSYYAGVGRFYDSCIDNGYPDPASCGPSTLYYWSDCNTYLNGNIAYVSNNWWLAQQDTLADGVASRWVWYGLAYGDESYAEADGYLDEIISMSNSITSFYSPYTYASYTACLADLDTCMYYINWWETGSP